MSLVVVTPFVALCLMNSVADELYYRPFNVTRTTTALFAAYRSALTLDWLAAEDSRQREMAAAFETQSTHPPRFIPMECISYPRPSPGKVAQLLLELLKNLEGDDGFLIPDLIQALIRSKLLLVETSIFEAEPDFESLVKTPGNLLGEPLTTFPRIMAMVWLSVTDPVTRKHGWCAVNKVTQYLTAARPNHVAKNMKALDPILVRARYIMEEFIQQVTPLNMMNRPSLSSPIVSELSVKNYDEEDAPKDIILKKSVDPHSQKQQAHISQDNLEDARRRLPPTMDLHTNHVVTSSTTLSLHLVDENDMSIYGYNRSLRLCNSVLIIVLTILLFL